MNKEQRIKIKHFSLPKSKVIRLCSLLLVLCSLPINAQQQWYFSVDERYPAERSELKNSRRILVVNNALTQPKDFGHTTMIDGESKGGVVWMPLQSLVQTSSRAAHMHITETSGWGVTPTTSARSSETAQKTESPLMVSRPAKKPGRFSRDSEAGRNREGKA